MTQPLFPSTIGTQSRSAKFLTMKLLLSKGQTIRLYQNQKINSFSILGVAYIARHSLVKDTRESRKERQMGA